MQALASGSWHKKGPPLWGEPERPEASALRREAREASPQVGHGEAEREGGGESVDGLLCLGLAFGEAKAKGRGLLTAGEDGGGEGAGGGDVVHMFCWVHLRGWRAKASPSIPRFTFFIIFLTPVSRVHRSRRRSAGRAVRGRARGLRDTGTKKPAEAGRGPREALASALAFEGLAGPLRHAHRAGEFGPPANLGRLKGKAELRKGAGITALHDNSVVLFLAFGHDIPIKGLGISQGLSVSHRLHLGGGDLGFSVAFGELLNFGEGEGEGGFSVHIFYYLLVGASPTMRPKGQPSRP